MKTLVAILLSTVVAVGILGLPELLDLHWWTYLLAAPAAVFAGLVMWLGSVLVIDP